MIGPRTWWQKLTGGEFLFEVVLALCAAAIGATNGLKSFHATPPDYLIGWASYVATIAMFVALIFRAIHRNRRAQNETELTALDGVLDALHAILENQFPASPDGGLRACIFIPDGKPDRVHQFTDYVGVDGRYGRGRTFSTRCGVVGKAFRSGQSQYDRLPKNSTVVDYLVHAHGFDRSEAAKMRQDRKSWAAIPVGEQNRVVAVIFLDSAESEFFGTKTHLRRKTLEGATLGVAKFIARL